MRGVGIACGNHWCGWRTGFDANVWRTGYRDPSELFREDPSTPYIRPGQDGKIAWRDHFEQALYDSDASSCILTMNEDGTVIVQVGDPEIGQGLKTTVAMIAAEELGLAVEDVKIVGVDTDSGAFGIGSYSSRVTLVLGNAVVDASRKAKTALFQIASELLGEPPEALEAKNRRIFVRREPARSVLVSDVAFRAYSRREGGELVFHGYHDPDSTIPDKESGQGTISSTWSYFAQAAEVEVDRVTGDVKLLGFASAHDVGRLINPLGAEGQVEGAVHQGIGYAFFEELQWPGKGRTMNANLLNYRIATAEDMCRVKPLFVETDDPKGPYGAKGLGEPASVAVAPAIVNAVENAVGCRIRHLPITPDRILDALKHRGDGNRGNRDS